MTDSNAKYSKLTFSEPISAERLNQTDISNYIPELPGIYMWQRKISPRSKDIVSNDSFSEWLIKELNRANGIIEQDIRHYAKIHLKIGVSELSKTKNMTITNLISTNNKRKQLRNLLQSLDYTVTLYVGESSNLAKRVQEHMNCETNFMKDATNKDIMGYTFEMLGIRYAILDNFDQKERQSLERIVASLTLAPATRRAG